MNPRMKRFRLSLVVLFVPVLFCAWEAGASIQSNNPSFQPYQPKWVRELASEVDSKQNIQQIPTDTNNSSYFTDYNHGLNTSKEIQDMLMDENEAKAIRQTMRDMNRDYEMRKQYGLQTKEEEAGFMDRMQTFARWIMQKVFRKQVNRGIEKTKKNVVALQTFENAQKTVNQVMRPTLGLQSSEKSKFKFKVGTKADLPKQKGQLWFNSDLVDGAVDVRVGQPWGFDPGTLSNVNTKKELNESYRLTMSKGLPVWELRTGVVYGGTTKVMTTSLSKNLTQGLNVELSNRRSMNQRVSPLPPEGEHIFKFNYGMRF